MQSPNKNKLLDGVFDTKDKLQELDELKEIVHQTVHANIIKDTLELLIKENNNEKSQLNPNY